MGIVSSTCCALMFCIERVATWALCATLLIILMFLLIVLMVYGITVGYHYAQKELAAFALESRRTTTVAIALMENDTNSSSSKGSLRAQHGYGPTEPMELDVFGTNAPTELTDDLDEEYATELERPTKMPATVAKPKTNRLVRRYRRARKHTDSKWNLMYYITEEPFLRPLKYKHGNVTRHFVT